MSGDANGRNDSAFEEVDVVVSIPRKYTQRSKGLVVEEVLPPPSAANGSSHGEQQGRLVEWSDGSIGWTKDVEGLDDELRIRREWTMTLHPYLDQKERNAEKEDGATIGGDAQDRDFTPAEIATIQLRRLKALLLERRKDRVAKCLAAAPGTREALPISITEARVEDRAFKFYVDVKGSPQEGKCYFLRSFLRDKPWIPALDNDSPTRRSCEAATLADVPILLRHDLCVLCYELIRQSVELRIALLLKLLRTGQCKSKEDVRKQRTQLLQDYSASDEPSLIIRLVSDHGFFEGLVESTVDKRISKARLALESRIEASFLEDVFGSSAGTENGSVEGFWNHRLMNAVKIESAAEKKILESLVDTAKAIILHNGGMTLSPERAAGYSTNPRWA